MLMYIMYIIHYAPFMCILLSPTAVWGKYSLLPPPPPETPISTL